MGKRVQLQSISPKHWAIFNILFGIMISIIVEIRLISDGFYDNIFAVLISPVLITFFSWLFGLTQAALINLILTLLGGGPVFKITDFKSFQFRFRQKDQAYRERLKNKE